MKKLHFLTFTQNIFGSDEKSKACQRSARLKKSLYVFIVAGAKPRVLIVHLKTSKRSFQLSLS